MSKRQRERKENQRENLAGQLGQDKFNFLTRVSTFLRSEFFTNSFAFVVYGLFWWHESFNVFLRTKVAGPHEVHSWLSLKNKSNMNRSTFIEHYIYTRIYKMWGLVTFTFLRLLFAWLVIVMMTHPLLLTLFWLLSAPWVELRVERKGFGSL